MAWVLTRGLTTVRAEFNTVFPGRDEASDGSVGDLDHQTNTSGHNPDRTGNAEYRDGDSLDEVRAIDVDRDLVPGSATDWAEMVIQYLVTKARAGGYVPFRYLIYKSRIWSRSDGWKTRTYTGANDHSKHLHGSGDYTQTADNWTGSLGLASLREAPVTQDEIKAIAREVWGYLLDIDVSSQGVDMQPAGGIVRYMDNRAKRSDALVKDVQNRLDRLTALIGTMNQPGPAGKDGKDGVFTGTLNITGGQLTAAAVEGQS